MKVAIMQPYFMPYLGYWQLMGVADIFVYYDDVTFIKQGWINRNRILLNGLEHLFTLQVKGASSFTLIKDVFVGDNRKKLHKTLSQAYVKAPYYEERKLLIDKVFLSEERNLANYIEESHKPIIEMLGIRSAILRSSRFDFDSAGNGQDRIIRICRELGATTYINAIGGTQLYSNNAFAEAGIDLRFIQPLLTPYRQHSAAFVGGLSILDILMYNNTNAVIDMLGHFQLVKKEE